MRIDRSSKGFVVIQGTVDLLIVYVAYYLAIFPFNRMHETIIGLNDFIIIMPFVMASAFLFFEAFGVFKYGEKTYVETVISIVLAIFLSNGFGVIVAFGLNQMDIPAKLFVFASIIELLIFVFYKFLINKMYNFVLKAKKIVIVGNAEEIEKIAYKSNYRLKERYEIIGTIEKVDAKNWDLLDQSEGIFIGASVGEADKNRILRFSIEKDKSVYIIPDLFEISLNRSKFIQIDDIPMFYVDSYRLTIEERFAKRLIDIICAFLLIMISLPLMLIAALGTKLYDRGPVFFKQERITRGGRAFELIKFRTMVVDAESKTGPVWSAKNDPRITAFGAFLRKTRMDELPQFINVLKGDMSLVGPRPERQCFIDDFEGDIPNFKYRVVVKAGITGLAQVMGKYNTTPEDKLKFDLMYITNYSVILDFKLLLQTIRVVFSKESTEGVKAKKTGEAVGDSGKR